jgi:hypothetical protein
MAGIEVSEDSVGDARGVSGSMWEMLEVGDERVVEGSVEDVSEDVTLWTRVSQYWGLMNDKVATLYF